MILEAITVIGVPVTGWLITKQLDINAKVAEHETKLSSIEEDVAHTRNRVDALYDHLIAQGGPRKG